MEFFSIFQGPSVVLFHFLKSDYNIKYFYIIIFIFIIGLNSAGK